MCKTQFNVRFVLLDLLLRVEKMCIEQCLRLVCCVTDQWKRLLLASVLGTIITMIDIYSDVFVAIDFLYLEEYYWTAALIGIIALSNSFVTREVIIVMEPESFVTVFCVATLSMLGFGPVVLLCFLFFDADNQSAFHSAFKINSARDHIARIRAIESFSQAMLSFSLQTTYLILLSDERIRHSKNLMIIISIILSIFSFGSGLTKWVRNYARIRAFHS